ncbi:SCO family protein [Pelagovum pacificum]|uniref:SCO family protein n=1 Tax=Pelagovum pacificum TaxID=2588711 RepID=A0A5C5GD67_9RHOB|nr:SCO family protein [Pelagovum pacificum]QQA44260.1 SCO family protein [Pelagovum pacificum]TNY32618.1 SCO family protein [Pelagovum pacificum]
MPRLTSIQMVLWGLVVIALVGVGMFAFVLPRLDESVSDTLGHGDYELVTTDGQPFTEESLLGEPTAIFFGFTHCPEVCPTTLSDIDLWQQELAETGDQIRVFFVTVDPERDTAEVLGNYVSWVPGVSGVTGSEEQIAEAIRAFRIYAAKIPLDDGGYTMDHSAMVLLFDENGRLVEPIAYQEPTDSAVETIRSVM